VRLFYGFFISFMSISTMASETAPAPTPAPTPAPVKDAFLNKIEKGLDQYRQKIAKLQQENERLRALNQELRSANSRVRRIPKSKVEVQPTA
jgi:hypothetical protein